MVPSFLHSMWEKSTKVIRKNSITAHSCYCSLNDNDFALQIKKKKTKIYLLRVLKSFHMEHSSLPN